MEKLPYVVEFKTSIGIVIKQFVTEETILKLKELEHSNSQTHKEFEIGVIKLLILDTYRGYKIKEKEEVKDVKNKKSKGIDR